MLPPEAPWLAQHYTDIWSVFRVFCYLVASSPCAFSIHWPLRREILSQCCFNVGPRRRPWANIKLALGQRLLLRPPPRRHPARDDRQNTPLSATHLHNVCPILTHRLRRWPSIGQTMCRCVVFPGLSNSYNKGMGDIFKF